VVVNAGVTHIELLGSADAIAAAKAEVFGRLSAVADGQGCAVYPSGDPRLSRLADAAAVPRRLTFGEDPEADVRLISYRPLGTDASALVLRVDGSDHAVELPLIGKHNAIDACCALAAAFAVGVPVDRALPGIARVHPPSMRSEVSLIGGRYVLIDCYNANPTSMTAALIALAERRRLGGGSRAIAILGDMLELGTHAADAHRDAGRVAAELGIEVIALGTFKETVAAGNHAAGGVASVADDPGSAARQALARTEPGDWILVKASRGMRLERVVTALREDAA
jgi:UDP-N-acetylmuramyl pentapeptide synthase